MVKTKKTNLIWITLMLFSTIANAIEYQNVNDTNIYLNAEKYRENSGWVNIEFLVKSMSGNVDFALGFNTSNTQPTQMQWYRGNYTQQISANSTTYNISQENWTSITYDNLYSQTYDGKNKWYVFKNVSITANRTYKAKIYLDVTDLGKYDIAIKRSADTLVTAISTGRFYFLDPFFGVQTIIAGYEAGADNVGFNYGNHWCYAQSFNITGNKTQYNVNRFANEYGAFTGTPVLEFAQITSDAGNKPNMSQVIVNSSSFAIAQNQWNNYSNNATYGILQNNTKYWIVVRTTTTTGDNLNRWSGKDSVAGGYANGRLYESTDCNTWNGVGADYDWNFRVYEVNVSNLITINLTNPANNSVLSFGTTATLSAKIIGDNANYSTNFTLNGALLSSVLCINNTLCNATTAQLINGTYNWTAQSGSTDGGYFYFTVSPQPQANATNTGDAINDFRYNFFYFLLLFLGAMIYFVSLIFQKGEKQGSIILKMFSVIFIMSSLFFTNGNIVMMAISAFLSVLMFILFLVDLLVIASELMMGRR